MDSVTSVIYRESQQQILSAGKDGMMYLWERPEMNSEGTLEGPDYLGELDSRYAEDVDFEFTDSNGQINDSGDRFFPPIIQNYLDELQRVTTQRSTEIDVQESRSHEAANGHSHGSRTTSDGTTSRPNPPEVNRPKRLSMRKLYGPRRKRIRGRR
jgi:hypothetical protein